VFELFEHENAKANRIYSNNTIRCEWVMLMLNINT